jgi:hypothetical protein
MLSPTHAAPPLLLLLPLLIALAHAVAQQEGETVCSRALASAGPNVNPRAAADDLHEAVRSNDLASACALLSAGADPSQKDLYAPPPMSCDPL